MKKLILAFMLLAVVGVVYFLIQTKSTKSAIPTPDSQNQQEQLSQEQDSPTHYLNYSPDLLTEDPKTKYVLYFYANWCPTCKPVHAELIKRDMEIPNDLIVMKVNYNDKETDATEKELAYKYGVTYQHTFVQIDKNGTEIKKWQGGGLDDIISNLQ